MTIDLHTAQSDVSHETEWGRALPWERYLEDEVREHAELWRGVWERATSPDDQLARLAAIGGRWRLLVLSEDWCGDASNTVPVLARFALDAPQLEIRILKRDANLELMDRYLTNGSRSIPLAIVLDPEGTPVARWGPRPAELQELVISQKRAGERPVDEIYKDTRRWYAKDHGRTTIRELVDRIAEAAGSA
ncbi:MAG: thioredoxin family protein [Gemmatimonadota bacterium]|nr:thioredoxin family protein [Gemmatimonadota bacterium]